MGKDKYQHIQELMNQSVNKELWRLRYHRYPMKDDYDQLFEDFIDIQLGSMDSIEIIPETKKIINYLNENQIKVGVTTGFNNLLMLDIKDLLDSHNIHIDSYISSSCLNRPGRPYPHMINNLMNQFEIDDPSTVVKVDDTRVGLQEGINANCKTIGVSRWSINMNIQNQQDISIIEGSHTLLKERIRQSTMELELANPDFVVPTLNEVQEIIHEMNEGTM